MSAQKIRKGKHGGTGVHAGATVHGALMARTGEVPAMKQHKDYKCDIINGHASYHGTPKHSRQAD